MTTKNPKQLIQSLDDFIANESNAESMTDEQAHEALRTNLIEITRNNSANAQGVLVTEDGYFLTCLHCVNEDISKLEVQLRDGSDYNIEKVCVIFRSYDLALAKADIPGECKAVKYKFFDSKQLDMGMSVNLVGRYCEQDYQKSGQITHLFNDIVMPDDYGNPCSYPDNFMVNFPVGQGDSGAIAASEDYRIMGIINAGDQANIGMSSKWKAALDLIDFYKEKVKKE